MHQPAKQIDNDFVNRPTMACTQILVHNPKAQNKDLRWLAVDNQKVHLWPRLEGFRQSYK